MTPSTIIKFWKTLLNKRLIKKRMYQPTKLQRALPSKISECFNIPIMELIVFYLKLNCTFPKKLSRKKQFSLRFAHFSPKSLFFVSDCLQFMAYTSRIKHF